jgi:Fe-S oxidoreductase
MLKVCLSVCPSQWETSFFILRLFEVLIELYYRLSGVTSPNPRSVFRIFFLDRFFYTKDRVFS